MPDVFVNKPKAYTHPKVTQHRELTQKEKYALPGYTKNPISAYSYHPDHVRFIGADSQEQIVLLLRRHPITNVGWVFTAFLLIFGPLTALFFGFLDLIPANFLIVSFIFWYLISFAFIFEEFLSWFFNVYIVTDERVFDVDFISLTYREITDANLDQIQDVTVKVGSVIRTIFDFGDVNIQTAAAVAEIDFEAVPHPDRVAQVLRELRVEEEIEKTEGRVR